MRSWTFVPVTKKKKKLSAYYTVYIDIIFWPYTKCFIPSSNLSVLFKVSPFIFKLYRSLLHSICFLLSWFHLRKCFFLCYTHNCVWCGGGDDAPPLTHIHTCYFKSTFGRNAIANKRKANISRLCDWRTSIYSLSSLYFQIFLMIIYPFFHNFLKTLYVKLCLSINWKSWLATPTSYIIKILVELLHLLEERHTESLIHCLLLMC